jgi:hypothetical protein
VMIWSLAVTTGSSWAPGPDGLAASSGSGRLVSKCHASPVHRVRRRLRQEGLRNFGLLVGEHGPEARLGALRQRSGVGWPVPGDGLDEAVAGRGLAADPRLSARGVQ